jgi:hypothetical protein
MSPTVGQAPWPAADALVGPVAITLPRPPGSGADQGVCPTRGNMRIVHSEPK